MQLAPNLSAVNTNPAAALAEYGLMILQVQERLRDGVREPRDASAFLRAIPGLDDYALLGKAWFHTTEEKRGKPVWDTVVFDMPASGHSVSMLRMPWVITETVPEGPLTRDARTIKELLDRSRAHRRGARHARRGDAGQRGDRARGQARRARHRAAAHRLQSGLSRHFPPGSPVAKVLDALVADPRCRRRSPRSTQHAHALARSPRAQRALPRRAARAREDAGARAADACSRRARRRRTSQGRLGEDAGDRASYSPVARIGNSGSPWISRR